MSLSVSFRGSDKLDSLAHRLEAAGRRDLEEELDAELRKPARRLRSAVYAAVPPHMPVGYEVPLATSLRFNENIRTGGSGGRVQVTLSSRRDIRALEDGRLRHPVFGNQDVWVVQRIRPGFWSEPTERVMGEVQDGMVAALDRVAAKIAGG